MSLTRKIAEGVFALSSQQVATAFIGFFTAIILIRTLGTYEYGLLTLALAAFAIASIFLDFGIGSVITTDMARELGAKRSDRAKSLFVGYMQAEVMMGLVLFILVFLSAGWVQVRYNEIVAELVKVCAFLLILGGVKNVFFVAFNSHTEFKYLSFMRVIEGAAMLALVFTIVLVMRKGVIGAMCAYPLAALTSIVFSLPMFMRTIGHLRGIDRAEGSLFFNTLKGHGKWVPALVPFKRLGDNATPWIIQLFLGVESVAIFQVAFRGFGFFQSLIGSLESTLMPITSREILDWERTKNMLNRSIKYALWISLPLVVFLLIIAPFLIEFLFTERYLASVPIFRVLLLMLLVYTFGLIFRPLFYALKAQKQLFYSYAIWAPSLIILEIVLINLLDLIGIALAMVINAMLITCFRYHLVKKIKDFKIKMDFGIDDFDKKLLKDIIKEIEERV